MMQEPLINLIFFGIFVVLLGAISYTAIAFGIRNKKLSREIVQLNLDKIAVLSKLESEIDARQTSSIEKSDGFISFLSQSRDWAFEYIEGVQKALSDFDTNVGKTIQYYKTYGQALGDTPHTRLLDEIIVEYDKLKEIMPENKDDTTPKEVV